MMIGVIILLSVFWLRFDGVVGYEYNLTNDDACPCLQNLNWTNSSFYDHDRGCLMVQDGSGACINDLKYGAQGCGYYDSATDDCKVTESLQPAWCTGKFCFVDPGKCERPYSPSDYFPGMFYSYATCGNLNTFTVERAFHGRLPFSLRVSHPGDSSNGYAVIHRKDGTVVGSFPAFMERVFKDANISFTTKQISQDSREKYPLSSYSACVHDVGLNRTDICVGSFWRTAEREMITPFVVNVEQDLFFLVTYVEEEGSFWDILTRPFRPFTFGLWIAIFLTIIILSAVMLMFEYKSKDSFLNCSSLLTAYSKSVYMGWISFVSASPSYKVTRKSSAAVNGMFGLFLTVVLATYTANLASFLVTRSISGTFNSIEQVLSANQKVCMLDAIHKSLSMNFPKLETLGIPKETTTQVVDGMDARECAVGVVSKMNFEGIIGNGHCNKKLVGDVVYSIGKSMPVSADHHHYLSYLVVRAQVLGWFDAAESRAKSEYLGQLPCSSTEETNYDESQAITFEDLAGLFLITGAVSVIAMVLFWFDECSNPKKSRNDQNIAPAGTGTDGSKTISEQGEDHGDTIAINEKDSDVSFTDLSQHLSPKGKRSKRESFSSYHSRSYSIEEQERECESKNMDGAYQIELLEKILAALKKNQDDQLPTTDFEEKTEETEKPANTNDK